MKNLLRLALIAGLLFPATLSRASQGSGCMPTSGTVSGLTLVQDINAANAAFISMNSGATAPTTDCTTLSIYGQLWLDTSSKTVKIYDGASWLALGQVDTVAHIWQPRIGGGSASLTAGTTTDLASVGAGLVTITGNTSITSFGSNAETGTIKLIKFSGTPTLTASGNLILPSGGSIVAVAGDQAFAVYLGGGAWSIAAYTRADGTSVSTSSVFIGAVYLQAPITPTTISANTNDWSPTGVANSNVIRLSSTAPFNITGLLAPLTDGRLVELYNAGTFNVTLTSQDASSTAGNRFAFGASYVLRPGASLAILYDLTAARWHSLTDTPDQQAIAGGVKNLIIANNAASPLIKMDITADALTVEDAFGRSRRLSSVNVSPDMTASGINGLDTGSIVNNVITWYYEFVVYNPITGVTGGLFSVQSLCANVSLPSGYTYCARVGANRTDGAATARWMGVLQKGKRAQFTLGIARTTVIPTVIATAATSFTAASVANFVPPTAYAIQMFAYSRNSTGTVYIAPNNSYATLIPTSGLNAPAFAGANASGAFTNVDMVLESGNVYVATNGAVAADFYCKGWDDNL